MVIAHNIEVSLARKRDHGHRYPEYAIPVGSPQDNFDPKEVFAEVLTDDSSAIFVNLIEGYDPKRAPHLQVRFWVDAPNDTATDVETITFTDLEAAAKELGRTSLKDDTLEPCDVEVAGELEQCGKIVVEVQRGRETHGKKVKTGDGYWSFANDADDITAAAKDVVKDGHVSHAIKYINFEIYIVKLH
ncbi:hypothetical protein LTR95_018181 [Oleoguttula sp. CCFEE 5521]